MVLIGPCWKINGIITNRLIEHVENEMGLVENQENRLGKVIGLVEKLLGLFSLFIKFESSRLIKEILYKIKLIKKFYKDFKYWIIQGKFLRSLICKKKEKKLK